MPVCALAVPCQVHPTGTFLHSQSMQRAFNGNRCLPALQHAAIPSHLSSPQQPCQVVQAMSGTWLQQSLGLMPASQSKVMEELQQVQMDFVKEQAEQEGKKEDVSLSSPAAPTPGNNPQKRSILPEIPSIQACLPAVVMPTVQDPSSCSGPP